MKEYFKVSACKYDSTKNYDVVRPSSLNKPKNNSVMFITKEHIHEWRAVLSVKECIVVWPESEVVPEEVTERHAVMKCADPRQGYAMFYKENHITYNALPCEYELVNGAYIAKGARVGKNTVVFPGVYIDSNVIIGDNCYIASGVKLIGNITIGNDVIIRENTVIGSDGLTRMRDAEGKVATIPQFGGVKIEDNVQIGALSVIAKGAIDDTVIHAGCRIDNCCFISHNVELGEDSVIVGETIMFGSSSTGKQAFISGNVTVRDGVRIGEKSFVGMGATVTKSVQDGVTVKGSPAK